jgi:hypothetical protein
MNKWKRASHKHFLGFTPGNRAGRKNMGFELKLDAGFDWVYVFALNTTYYCDFGKKKQMVLQLSEILIPILEVELTTLVTANGV